MLPAPVAGRLDAARQVTIVPHEILWRVPFQALPSGDGYLADHADVVVAGSVAMAALRPHKGRRGTDRCWRSAPATLAVAGSID